MMMIMLSHNFHSRTYLRVTSRLAHVCAAPILTPIFNPHIFQRTLFSTQSSSSSSRVTNDPDPQVASWIDNSRLVPTFIRPYLKLARVDRPAGISLALLPAWASLAMCAPVGSPPDALLCSVFAVGAFFVRGAGCALNDVWDARFDAAVARTRARPIASGAISRGAAMVTAGVLLLAAGGAALHLNACATLYAVAAVPLVALYPAAKRIIAAPQIVLGFVMNWGVLVGAAAVRGDAGGSSTDAARDMLLITKHHHDSDSSDNNDTRGRDDNGVMERLLNVIDQVRETIGAKMILVPERKEASIVATHKTAVLPSIWQLLTLPFKEEDDQVKKEGGHHGATAPLFFYAGCVLWTIFYDTIYAHQDRRDDTRLNLGNAARWIGVGRSRLILSLVAAGAVSAWTTAGIVAGLAWPWAAAVATVSGHFAWQISTARWDDGPNLTRRFVSNQTVGIILVSGAVAGRWLQKDEDDI